MGAFLPDNVELYSIELPGRGRRISEAPYHYLPDLIQDITTALLPLIDRPFAFFGHSLGAIVSFEIARYLAQQRRQSPIHLFVSGRRAPQVQNGDPPAHLKNDEDFLERVLQYNGMPPDILAQPELLELLLPVLRADFKLSETYVYMAAPPLVCRITAFGGAEDEESINGRLDAWKVQTTNVFGKVILPGGHFFINTEAPQLLRMLYKLLDHRA